jgi:hypothetical protein
VLRTYPTVLIGYAMSSTIPTYVEVALPSDDKKGVGLNCLAHGLNLIPYKRVTHERMGMPKRSMKCAHDDQESLEGRKLVKENY